MTDPPRRLDTGDDPGTRYERESTGVPRWVKLAAIAAAVLALLVLAIMLIGGGGHMPRRHGPPGDDARQLPAATVPRGHVPPAGGHG